MGEGVFFFIDIGWLMLFFALVASVWALLIMGILAVLDAWFGIDLLARWKKRE